MPTRSRVERLVQYVAAMKLHEYPNAGVLAQATGRFPGVTTKTVYRDVAYLRERLHAPVTYDERHRGYFIDDPDWAFPFAELQAHSLFAILICGRVSTPLLPEHLRRETDEVLHSQLAITAPDDLDGELLRSLVFATGARVLPDAAVFDTVCAAWRERRGLALTYRDANGQCGPRQIDVHSLFLSDGAWYARAWCHRRSGWRSFA